MDYFSKQKEKVKLLRREIQIKRTAQRLLLKKNKPDQKQIAQLTGEIFELQRAILTKTQHVAIPATG